MAKEFIYLTDITFHVREKRQTANFSKVAEKGRFYNPLPAKAIDGSGGKENITLELPEDLKDRVRSGEIEIRIPKDGLPIHIGKDVEENIKGLLKTDRHELIHRSRNKTWSASDKSE